jgi:hypothetical protein
VAEEKVAWEAVEAEVAAQPQREREAQLDHVHALAARLDLVLERADGSMGQRWRLVTEDRSHRLLPGPYDAAAAWANVGTFVRGGRKVYVLNGFESP